MIKYGTNNIGKIYFGSNPIGKAYFGSNLVYQSGGGSSFPTGYTQLSYVESPSSKTVYVNTGIAASNSIGFEIDAYTYDAASTSGYGCFFGGRVSSGQNDFQLTTYTANSFESGTLRVGTGSGLPYVINGHIPLLTRFTATLHNGTYTIDGSSYSVIMNINNGQTIYLFALNNNGTAAQFGRIRIYSFKLYDGSTEVLNYVPCYRNSDNKVGFYDFVNNTFVLPTGGNLIGGE